MMKALKLIAMCIMFSMFGCASIVSKSEWPVNVTSTPDGADITITNRDNQNIFSGRTPTIITLDAGAGYFTGENYTVTFKKDGFQTQTAQINRGVNGWYLGNLVFGGLVGFLIVDPITGAMWTLDDLHVDLSTTSSLAEQNELRVMTLNEVPVSLRSHMVRIN